MFLGLGGVMGRGYTIFDTAIGRSAIVWSDAGVVGVHLPEAREIDTRRRVYQLYPEARETRPPINPEIAIEAIATLLRGEASDFNDVTLDMRGIHVFNQRVYELTRLVPRGETRTYSDIATRLGAPSAARSVAQAIMRTRFRRTAAPSQSAICCRSRVSTPPATTPCSTHCSRLPRRVRITRCAA